MTFGYSKLCLKVIALYFAMIRYSEALGAVSASAWQRAHSRKWDLQPAEFAL